MRIASRIGIDRIPREVTPDLQTYLKTNYNGSGDSDLDVDYEDAEDTE